MGMEELKFLKSDLMRFFYIKNVVPLKRARFLFSCVVFKELYNVLSVRLACLILTVL